MQDIHPIFSRYQELKELIRVIRHEIQQAQRPPDQIILVDQDVMQILKISKRKLEYLKSEGEIPYHQPKQRSSTYYLLSDILEWLQKNRVESINNKCKL